MQRTSVAAEEAAVGREMLDRVLLEATPWVRDSQGRRVADALSVAGNALSELSRSAPTEQNQIELLSSATDAVERAAEVLSRFARGVRESLRPQAERVHSIAGALRACREQALQQLEAPTGASEASAPAPLSASHGVPALFALPARGLRFRPTRATSLTSIAEPHLNHEARDALVAWARRASREGERALANDPLSTRDAAPGLLQLRTPRRAGEDIDAGGSAGETAQLRRIARDCMEEIGALGNIRYVRRGEMWHSGMARSDERLLANLDALASLGQGPRRIDVLEQLMRWTSDDPTPSVFRPFTRALVLGCTKDPRAAQMAVLLLQSSPEDSWEAQAHALALASSPSVDDALASAVADGAADALPQLLDTMRARQRVAAYHVALLLEHADDAVRRAAVRCAAAIEPAEAGRELLLEVVKTEIDDVVLAEALSALAVLDVDAARKELRFQLQRDETHDGSLSHEARRMMLTELAICGSASDRGLLSNAVMRHPDDAGCVGWHGHRGLIEPLLALLEHERMSVRRSAAQSLHRITGAELSSASETYEPTPYRPTTERLAWHRWWQQHGERFDDGTRHRLGEPFSVSRSSEEQRASHVPMAIREQLGHELAVAAGRLLPDERAWVAQQERALTSLAAWAAAEGGDGAGRWLDGKRPKRST